MVASSIGRRRAVPISSKDKDCVCWLGQGRDSYRMEGTAGGGGVAVLLGGLEGTAVGRVWNWAHAPPRVQHSASCLAPR